MAKKKSVKEDIQETEKVQEQIVKADNTELLTENQVWDVIRFARAITGGPLGIYLTPDLINARLKDVTLNPLAATQEMLDQATVSPKEYETQLRDFSQNFELTSMVYKRIIAYLANMLAFDITYTTNAEPKDYTTPKFKKDLDSFETFLDRFDYKKEFRIVVKELLRNDAYFGCLVDTGKKYVLQELPSDYCKITGRWDGGFLFSFNMYWFLQPGVDINMYPAFFKRKYKELWEKGGNKFPSYRPSISPTLRGQSMWVYWVDIPVDLGVCFKLSPEIATRLPYFSPLFNDLILQGTMRNLQKNINMASASKIILGQVPMLNKDAKASIKDSIAVSPDLLGKFLALVKSAISDTSIKVASAPLEDMQGIDFKGDNDMYDSYMRTTLASSGINTNLIFTSNVKPNAIETQLSLNVDEQMMETLYTQFQDFINYFGGRHTKNFKFNAVFEGTEFFLNREMRTDRVLRLFSEGIVLYQKIAAAIGMKPAHFRKQMEEGKSMDFMGMLTIPSVEQQKQLLKVNPALGMKSGGSEKSSPSLKKGATDTNREAPRGRPRKRTSDLGEEGMKTRETGGNIGRGGKS